MKIADIEDRAVISVSEAGELLGLGRSASYAAAARGDFPVMQVGRRIFVLVRPFLNQIGGVPVTWERRGAEAEQRVHV